MNQNAKRWQQYRQDPHLTQEISERLKISPITSQVLINRGISDESHARSFLEPKLSDLKDPKEIPDILKAAKRVLLAKERGEKVFVYGDYDVDGVTATVIVLEALKFLGIDASYYVPHRYDEGYGMNPEAVQEIRSRGAGLIVTVDCGISNFDEIELANSLNMDVIVTDHHNPPERLPRALALVNPKLVPGHNPSRDLSGAGVAFKFAWALLREAGVKESGMLISLLDLVCLGTIADVVPLVGENRILAVQGLSALTSRGRLGLRSLMDEAGVSGNVTQRHVNFALAPRINAAGRLEHASLAIELLLASDETSARDMAHQLNKINAKRQSIGSEIQEEAFSLAKNAPAEDGLIVLEGKGWHPGVIGIVASQLVDAFWRPVVLIGVCNGAGRGSARSVDGVNVFALLQSCKDMFSDFGGHENAAGFEISSDRIPELKKRLLTAAKNNIKPEDLTPSVKIDCGIKMENISLGLVKELEGLGPHGKGNPEPVFMTGGLKLVDLKKVGDGSHLKAKFTDGRSTLDVIGFGLGDRAGELDYASNYDIAYGLRSSEWGGFETAELRLIDFKATK